jgi:methyltransferase (TIGR00027 family)
MAMFRALESSRPTGSRLFQDDLAQLFVHRWHRWLYNFARFDAGRRVVEHLFDREVPGARAAGIARTRWIDDRAVEALKTVPQLVLLGAGYDTRAYRLTAAGQAAVFELDRPEMLLAKQAALEKAIGSLPQHVRFAAIDFNRRSIGEVLSQAGFNGQHTACFIWEGVTNYLSAEAADGALRQIGKAAAGSVLLFTYIDRAVLETPARFHGAEKLLSRLRAYGEPWTFGIDPAELAGYLGVRGLRLTEDLSVAEVWRQAGRPLSQVRGYEFYRLASACLDRSGGRHGSV